MFDAVSLLVLVYDSLVVPYQLAWDIPYTGGMALLNWSITTFWAVDFLLGFVTGYFKGDELVMEYSLIARHYLATYFLPNLLVLAADILTSLFSEAGDNTPVLWIRLLRLTKLTRVLRLSSMFRTGKVAQLGDHLVTNLRRFGFADSFTFLTSVCKLVFYIIWVNHVGACLWYLVGGSAAKHWRQQNYVEDADQSSRFFSYLLSVYSSASLMIAGESVMTPTNSKETLVSVLFVIFGFIFSSVLISSLLTTVMAYQDANAEKMKRLKTLRQFLYQHNVEPTISVPIQRQVGDRLLTGSRLSEKDVAALSSISPLLRSELRFCIYGPRVAENVFIQMINVKKSSFLKEICYNGLEHAAHGPGVRIFEPATQAVGAHYVYWGKLDYLPASVQEARTPGENDDADTRTERVPAPGSPVNQAPSPAAPELKQVAEASWVCTFALWVHWLHRGWLEVSGHCELLTVQVEVFVRLLCSYPDLRQITQDYSSAVFDALRGELPGELTDVHSNVTHMSILPTLPVDTRAGISSSAITVLERRQWAGRLFIQDGLEELKAEIDRGECDLVLEANDEVFRLTTIAALRIERSDCILLQLGKCHKGQTIPSCVLPGTKLQPGETPQEAAKRILRRKLEPWKDQVLLRGRSFDVQERVSRKYGVPSRYMRSLFSAQMVADGDDQDATLAVDRRSVGIATRTSLGSASSVSDPFHVGRQFQSLHDYEAFVFRHELARPSPVFIYAWVKPQDVDRLTGKDGDWLVQKWLSELNLDEVTASTSQFSQRSFAAVDSEDGGLHI